MTSSPFKFLDSYTRADIGDFFGRDKETDELFRQCFLSPILVVYGGSGTGKTSLVQCGLSSRFQDSDWLPVPVRRSGDMIASVREAIHAVTLTPSNSTDLGQLAANLYLDHFKPIYFLFDQFEELFIFGGHAESEAFFAAMRALLEKERNAHAIFVVREEYLAELTRYESIIPGLIENRYRVERLTQRHAMEVVEKLCGAHNIPCAEGFSAALVGRLDPEGQGIELSYLQVFLDRCWRTRQGDEPFSPALLERIGHVDDMLGAFLDEQVADTPEPQRSESLLKTFVSDQGTKRQLTSTEAHDWVQTIGVGMDLSEVERLLQVFVAKRLLKDRDERGRYELLHDALARQIFQRITRAEQELIEVRQFVQQAYGQFLKRGVNLTANDLTYLRPYRNQLHLKGEVKEFVEGAFGEEERKERSKKLRRRILLASLLIACLFGGKVIADTQKRLAQERAVNESSRLAALATEMASRDPLSAYLLAERAYQLDPSISAERVVLQAYNGAYAEIARYEGNKALIPDDRQTFTIKQFDRFSVYNAKGQLLFERPFQRPSAGINYLGLGKHLLVWDSVVCIYDMQGSCKFQTSIDWRWSYGDADFIGAIRDGYVTLQGNEVKVLPWNNEVTWELFNDAYETNVSSDGNGMVQLLAKNEIVIVSARNGLHILDRIPLPVANTADGPDLILMETDSVLLYGVHGAVFVYDQRIGSWQRLHGLRGSVAFNGHAIISRGQDDPPFAVKRNGRFEEGRLKGRYMWLDPKGGLVLMHESTGHGDEKDYSLFDVSKTPGSFRGRRFGGRTAPIQPDEAIRHFRGTYIGHSPKMGFLMLSSLTPDQDRLSWYTSRAEEEGHQDLPKLAVVEGFSFREGVFTDTASDGRLVICAFHDVVIAGEQQRQCRIYMDGRVIFSTVLPTDHAFGEGEVFHVVSDSLILFGRQPDGISLVRVGSLNETLPFDLNMTYAPNGAVAYVAYTTDPSKSAGTLRVGLFKDGRYTEMPRPKTDTGMVRIIEDAAHHPIDPGITEDGRFLFANIGNRITRLDGYFNTHPDGVAVWNVLTGEQLKSKWLEDVKKIIKPIKRAQAILLSTADTLRAVDTSFAKRIWAEPLNDMSLLNRGENSKVILAGNSGEFRIVDASNGSVQPIHVDSARLGYFIPYGWPDKARWLNDSSFLLFASHNSVSGIQIIVSGKPGPLHMIPGNLEEIEVGPLATYATVWKYNIRASGIWIGRRTDDDRPDYFRLQIIGNDFRLVPATMAAVSDSASEYNVRNDHFLVRRQDDLLAVDGRLFDIHEPGSVLATHRLLSEFEEFPKSADAAIDMVRHNKVYGEFWKHINVEPQIRKVLGTEAYNVGYSIGTLLRNTWVRLGLLLGVGALVYAWWSRRQRLRAA